MPEQPSNPRNAPAPIVGIDLGTTNSLVAVADFPPDDPAAAAPRILFPEGQRAILPSVVRFNDDGSTTIGANARAEAVLHPTSTIHSAKRLMGRSLDDARHAAPYLSYQLVAGENNTARIALPDGKVVSPQEVSALILGALRE